MTDTPNNVLIAICHVPQSLTVCPTPPSVLALQHSFRHAVIDLWLCVIQCQRFCCNIINSPITSNFRAEKKSGQVWYHTITVNYCTPPQSFLTNDGFSTKLMVHYDHGDYDQNWWYKTKPSSRVSSKTPWGNICVIFWCQMGLWSQYDNIASCLFEFCYTHCHTKIIITLIN